MTKNIKLFAVLLLGMSLGLGSCSKKDDPDPKNNNTNTTTNPKPNNNNNNNNNPGGSGGNNDPGDEGDETITYSIEFLGGSRQGTKIEGTYEGFSYGGFTKTESGVVSYYFSFVHDTATISGNAAIDENGDTYSLDRSYNRLSYLNITLGNNVSVVSLSGDCSVKDITIGEDVSAQDDVKKAAFTFEFNGTFQETDFNTYNTTDYPIKGKIITRLTKQ